MKTLLLKPEGLLRKSLPLCGRFSIEFSFFEGKFSTEISFIEGKFSIEISFFEVMFSTEISFTEGKFSTDIISQKESDLNHGIVELMYRYSLTTSKIS